MKDTVTFKYVYIPCSPTDPVEERTMTVTKDKELESLLNTMKAHFKSTSPAETAAQRATRQQALLASIGGSTDTSKLTPEIMNVAMGMTMVENIALLANAPDTGYVGVNMYCDDHASLKHLPSNPRASDLAFHCGKPLDVKGDVFLGRVFDNEDEFKRLDFPLSDLSSSAQWVAEAQRQAERKRAQGDVASQWQQMQQRQRQEAATSAHLTELSPSDAKKEEGNAAFKAGRWQEAVDCYSAALALDPKLLPALNNRAMAYLRLGKLQEAAADCDTVLAGEPNNIKALLRRATARRGLGQAGPAVEDAAAVLRLQPNNKEAAGLHAELAAAVSPADNGSTPADAAAA